MGIYDRQESIKLDTEKSVSVVGAGGIGFWVTKFLAMSGVKKIFVYDFDTIEESNMNRLDIPASALGKNKAEVVKKVVQRLREDCIIRSIPFKFNASLFSYNPSDVIVDCTDKEKDQKEISKIASDTSTKYCKAGYDGVHMTISNTIPEWGDGGDDGYRVVPSWVVPSVIAASLTVAKVLKYFDKELSCNVNDLFIIN